MDSNQLETELIFDSLGSTIQSFLSDDLDFESENTSLSNSITNSLGGLLSSQAHGTSPDRTIEAETKKNESFLTSVISFEEMEIKSLEDYKEKKEKGQVSNEELKHPAEDHELSFTITDEDILTMPDEVSGNNESIPTEKGNSTANSMKVEQKSTNYSCGNTNDKALLFLESLFHSQGDEKETALVDADENQLKVIPVVESGFINGNNKKILINKNNIMDNLLEYNTSNDLINIKEDEHNINMELITADCSINENIKEDQLGMSIFQNDENYTVSGGYTTGDKTLINQVNIGAIDDEIEQNGEFLLGRKSGINVKISTEMKVGNSKINTLCDITNKSKYISSINETGIIESGFITGKNNKVLINKNNIVSVDRLEGNTKTTTLSDITNNRKINTSVMETEVIESGFNNIKNNKDFVYDKGVVEVSVASKLSPLFDIRNTNDTRIIESGFVTGKNNKVLIDRNNIMDADGLRGDPLTSNLCNITNTAKRFKNIDVPVIIESGFITGKNNKVLIDRNNIIPLEESEINNKYNTLCDMTNENVPIIIESGFVTGKNKKVFIDKNKIKDYESSSVGISGTENKTYLENNIKLNEENTLNENKLHCINGDEIKVSIDRKPECTHSRNNGKTPPDKSSKNRIGNKIPPQASNLKLDTDIPLVSMSIPGTPNLINIDRLPKHFPMRKYNCPQKGHSTNLTKDDIKMVNIYNYACKVFKKEEPQWIKLHFKWVWMHMLLNDSISSDTLQNDIISLMNWRLKAEYSILRRIVEFDDTSTRFMVLGVIEYNEAYAVLYDGFYSLKFEIDNNIYNNLKLNNCDMGSKLYVFGSRLLVTSPECILNISGIPLKLFYNSVRICYDKLPLGVCKKVSFLNTLSHIRKDGGVVSGLVLKIRRHIESRYLVIYDNYRNHCDDVDSEIDRIKKYALQAGFSLESDKLKVKPYSKYIMCDESGECLVTWWNSPEVKTGEVYKFVYLTPVEYSMGLHLSVTNKTYYEIMK